MDTLIHLLKQYAPTLATAVVGPAGRAVISLLANKFGVGDTVAEVAQAIAGDPLAGEKLAALEMDYYKTDQLDRSNARQMQEAALTQDDKFSKHFIYWFAWFWSATSVAYFFAITFATVPASGKDFGNIILGFLLGTAVATIISFFYGSSKSSKDKTDAVIHKAMS